MQIESQRKQEELTSVNDTLKVINEEKKSFNEMIKQLNNEKENRITQNKGLDKQISELKKEIEQLFQKA